MHSPSRAAPHAQALVPTPPRPAAGARAGRRSRHPTVAAHAAAHPRRRRPLGRSPSPQARATQNGSTATVRGYVVGQPTSSTTVVTSGFPNDFALALADTAGATDTGQMLYVQIPSAFRSAWGLKTNPGLMGRKIDVTGTLAAYFSHPGLTSGSAFAFADGGGDPDPDPGGPYDDTYYADAIGKTGAQLESSLHTIISTGDTPVSYDTVWDALKQTDQDPANSANVIALYSGFSMTQERQRRRRRPVEPRARLGEVPRRLRHRHRPRHRPAPPAARGRHRQLRARQPRLRRGRHPELRGAGQLRRRQLLGAAGRRQGRRRPDDLLHVGPLRRRRRLRRPRGQRRGRQRLRTPHRPAVGAAPVERRRTRPTRSRCAATTSSTTPGSTTGTRSSTTPSGPSDLVAIW